jgi:hypothetical protein
MPCCAIFASPEGWRRFPRLLFGHFDRHHDLARLARISQVAHPPHQHRRGGWTVSEAVRLRYPRKAEINRALQAAKAFGLDVSGFEVSPDGTIRIMEARAVKPAPANDFERFQDQL